MYSTMPEAFFPARAGYGEAEGEGDGLMEGLGLGDGDVEGVGVGVAVAEAEGDGVGVVVGVGVGVGVTLGFIEGFGVALTAGFTEALVDGEGEGVGVGSGVGVSVGVGLREGEDCSPKTSEEGKNIDFKKKPEPIRKKSKTPERIKVGREGLCNTITALYIMYLLTNFLPVSAFEYIF